LNTYTPHVAMHLVTQYLMKSLHMKTYVGYVMMLYKMKDPPGCWKQTRTNCIQLLGYFSV